MAEATTRERIQVVILAAVRDGAIATPLLIEEAVNLAAAVDEELFGLSDEDERVIMEWAAQQAAVRAAEHDELVALREEVRRLPVTLSNVGGEMVVVRLRHGSKAQHVHAPAIAAVLRSETHHEE